ncbi:MAG: ornithine cyclodeaminase family protein [Mesorhizobium sp.]|uniref:ornithine cyclodeaminase family protein n=1 Tax=Mesorhizobium sp. TaxID=1871066 RepID=UPI000FE5A4DF|nr:ornithine cyclodeaminase family protein [Mesorhizobium sp.]RWG50453.1 MAG: ornithine cyclodeaminase family protein [Mesorhizobium sp.]RWL05210.1 MAG: ornithine cyclodeaminase family protein [Mesorhizobium sp.]TIN10233.1 MAG: ornithine cyclodeaminase family protein [Mesorhizobium sp.]TIQ62170.1 MAG: ornithine cyclodeaminase family protein [Mesorhizobium sp.]
MTDASFRLVDAQNTAAGLPFKALVDALETGFANGCVVPARHHHQLEKTGEPVATLLLMPAWAKPDDQDQFLGVKLVTVVPGNAARSVPGLTSTYILYDAVTGQQLCLMDGNVITSRRTAATAALGARLLAREDARSLLVIGAGRVGSLIPDAYRAVRPIEKVSVWDIQPEAAQKLVRSLNERGIIAEVVRDLETAIAATDIVTAATLATEPVIKGKCIRKGTHIDLIGAFTPRMRESDDAALAMSRAFVDTDEALHEAGDLVQPIEGGVVSKEHILGTLADLAHGKLKGRTTADEITYFKAVGSGLADLVAARMVYKSFYAPDRISATTLRPASVE